MAPSFSKVHGGRSPSLLQQTEHKRNPARLPLAFAIALASSCRNSGLVDALSLPGKAQEAPTNASSKCPDDFVEAVKGGDAVRVKELLTANTLELKGCSISFEAKKSWGEEVPVTGIALHLAAYQNQLEVLQALLNAQADPNAPTTAGGWRFTPGTTALMLASWTNSLEVVNVLLAMPSIRVNDQNQGDHFSALILAAANSNAEVVRALLTREDVDVNLQAGGGYSALIWAACWNHVEVVRALLEREDVDINLLNGGHSSPLICAARSGHAEGGTSALLWAARRGHHKVVQMLLEKKELKCNLQCKDGRRALIVAAQRGHVDVVRALLAKKDTDLDVNLGDQIGNSALMAAVSSNNVTALEVVDLLLGDERTEIDRGNEDGMTPFMLAASRNSREAVRRLCHVANASVTDQDGATALVYAADISITWVAELLNMGIQAKLEDIFFSAALSGHRKASKQLRRHLPEHDSQYGECNRDGWAILAAARGGQSEMAQWFFQQQEQQRHGSDADVHCHGKDNYTALELAVRHGHYQITNTLLQHAASVIEDINEADDEVKAFAIWLGVEYSVPELVRPFANNETGDWAKNTFLNPPKGCEGDMKERCSGVLLGHAQSTDMVHLLWSWQNYLEANEEVWRDNRKEALVANLQRRGGEAAALALLSRGVELTEDELEGAYVWPQDANDTNQTLYHVKTWNRLHWCALSCDAVALASAYGDGRNVEIFKLLGPAEDGKGLTPKEVAEANRVKCSVADGVLRSLEDFRNAKRLEGKLYVFSATSAALVCIGIYTNRLLFLQHQSFQKRGWCFMLVVPTTLTSIGCGIAFLYIHHQGGLESVRSAMVTLGVAVAAAGVLLAVVTSVAFKSDRAAEYLRELKKKGNNKVDRCWEVIECGCGWFLLLVVFVQGLMILGKRLALLAGAVNAVASTLPLVMASPRSLAIPLRFIPGVCLVAWWAYNAENSERLPSPESLLISTMCLAVVWGEAGGLCAAAVGTVSKIVEIEMATKEGGDKFTAKALIFGRAEIAAQGIECALGLTTEKIAEGLRNPIETMRQEIAASGDSNDLENFKYIVEGTSGNPDDYPSEVAESLKTGKYHGGEIGPNDFDTGHHGRTLAGWMEEHEVKLANLTKAEFVAVRFYTSSSFPKINGPLRKKAQAIGDNNLEEKAKPHPWAMVVYLMDKGIKKLRSVQAQVDPEAFARQTTLWRGMKNMEVDTIKFQKEGGTEMAPMSTTTNEDVARHYATSEVPLVFKYVVRGLRTGVAIRFLSLYPKEEEYLYAPLTYLTLKNQYEDDGTTVLVVEPVMS